MIGIIIIVQLKRPNAPKIIARNIVTKEATTFDSIKTKSLEALT